MVSQTQGFTAQGIMSRCWTRRQNANSVAGGSAGWPAYLNKYQMVHWLIEQGAQVETYSATGSSLAWRVYDSVSIMAQQSPEYPWLLKVQQQLHDKGVTFPPRSPAEVRAHWEKGDTP